jgi:predicted O-methyltransferase YrrM
MKYLTDVTERYQDLPYMQHKHALYIEKIITSNNFKKIAELGHAHGKSSAYIASILKNQGYGKLTSYDLKGVKLSPNITQLLKDLELEQFVDVVISDEGYIWDLARRIKETPGNKFDCCYIDGGHTFEVTGLGFILIDILLEKNGIIIFDDINWAINDSAYTLQKYTDSNIFLTALQKKALGVNMVCEILVSKFNYQLIDWNDDLSWAVYKKL